MPANRGLCGHAIGAAGVTARGCNRFAGCALTLCPTGLRTELLQMLPPTHAEIAGLQIAEAVFTILKIEG